MPSEVKINLGADTIRRRRDGGGSENGDGKSGNASNCQSLCGRNLQRGCERYRMNSRPVRRSAGTGASSSRRRNGLLVSAAVYQARIVPANAVCVIVANLRVSETRNWRSLDVPERDRE